MRLELFTMQEVLKQASGQYRAVLASGQRLLEARLVFRKLAAAQTQQYRYQDMTFRIFRNDAIQKFRAQFDLAARYVFLAAKAYDYETNLLGSDSRAGRDFLTEIVRQRSLGEVVSGQPIAGTPGLANALARMGQNFDVLKGQLGFNNPQTETNQFSLRSQLFRQGSSSDSAWEQTLSGKIVADLWSVPEYRLHCRPFAPESNSSGVHVPQPGLVIRFSTNVTSGLNFFGRPLVAGDSAYDASNFATKVRSVGVWFEDYRETGLASTPRAYLVPAGMDLMRSPTGNSFATREWFVRDQKLPVPFPIGPQAFAQPDFIPRIDTLSEDLGGIRRSSSFRAYHDSGDSDAAIETETTADSRLVGRSVWNTNWVLIIPGASLLGDANEGVQTFVHGRRISNNRRDGNGVEDILIFFHTYAYSGN